MKTRKAMPPVHPGEILLKEFLEPMGISTYRLAKSLRVPAIRISNIVHGKTGLCAAGPQLAGSGRVSISGLLRTR